MNYTFETEAGGTAALTDLINGKKSLVVFLRHLG
jgi:predicted dithiol-disulfide oxidoreductase (DUF899 family)